MSKLTKQPLSRRQRWVKNAAIVFFSVLLVLTFFSNTIRNHSLAEVSTVQVSSETVSSKIRGTGTVEAGATTDLKLSESREITEVLVEEGDSVKAGDVLFRLKEGESAELKAAAEELQTLKGNYQHQILVEEIDASVVKKAQSGGIDYPAATAELKRLSAAVQNATINSEALQKQTEALERSDSPYNQQVAQATAALETANQALLDAEEQFSAYGYSESELLAIWQETGGHPDDPSIHSAKAALDSLNAARTAAATRTAELSSANDALEQERNRLAQASAQAAATLENATEAHSTYLANIQKIRDLESLYKEIQEKQAQYDKLAASTTGTEVRAGVDGRIASIQIHKGETTSPDTPLCSIADNKKGCTLRFSVTRQQASKVKPGDEASISNAWYYDGVSATLKSIKNDPQDPGKSKLLVFDIQGDVAIGQSMTLSVGEKSATYDCVVPNSAIRVDNNGSFLLIIREKPSPLGNRYIATRADIEVLAADDSKTAVKGPLEGYEYVITTSSKPIKPGEYVRLSEAAQE